MAARFDASGDSLSRAATGLGSSNVTMACWVYIDTDRNAFTGVMGADNGGAGWHNIAFDSDGTTVAAVSNGSNVIGSSLSTGTWYFVASVYDSGATDTLYWAAQSASSFTTATGTITGVTDTWTFIVGNTGFTEWLNGRIAFARVWTAALNSTELAAERGALSAVRTSNLWADWPLASDANDISGNGRNLTVNGSISYVGQPIGKAALAAGNTTAVHRASRW